jgi:hypothetical protein
MNVLAATEWKTVLDPGEGEGQCRKTRNPNPSQTSVPTQRRRDHSDTFDHGDNGPPFGSAARNVASDGDAHDRGSITRDRSSIVGPVHLGALGLLGWRRKRKQVAA